MTTDQAAPGEALLWTIDDELAGALAAIYPVRIALVSPPRTGSTAIARMLWQHTSVTHHCHEPFEACYWGGAEADPVGRSLRSPMAVETGLRVPLSQVAPSSGLLVKEMSFQLRPAQFRSLARLASTPVVFAVRDPRLAAASRLRIVRELYDHTTFPPFESGWASLAMQVRMCQEEGLAYLVVDTTDLRNDPVGMSQALLRALGLPPEPDIGSWSPRPGLQLCPPETGALMSDKRRVDDPFYRRVLASDGIKPVDRVDWAAEHEAIRAAGLSDDVDAWMNTYSDLRRDARLLRSADHYGRDAEHVRT
ncbi:MAG TPA: hypothetical protein VFM55_26390 [Micromonosporaceae bacterium]|nr:hypothetical protein [Micromonosporaceae bacterium]